MKFCTKLRFSCCRVVRKQTFFNSYSHLFLNHAYVHFLILRMNSLLFPKICVSLHCQIKQNVHIRYWERMTDRLFTDHEYTKLNKLKKSNPEAFFYLYLAFQLSHGHQTWVCGWQICLTEDDKSSPARISVLTLCFSGSNPSHFKNFIVAYFVAYNNGIILSLLHIHTMKLPISKSPY